MTEAEDRDLERLEAPFARWKAQVDSIPIRDDVDFSSVSGTPIEMLYTPLDTATDDYAKDLGFPGEYPFTRGPYSTMYRTKLWTMRQFSLREKWGSAESPSPASPTWRRCSRAFRSIRYLSP